VPALIAAAVAGQFIICDIVLHAVLWAF